jgi:arylsulfatase A-like enzyme
MNVIEQLIEVLQRNPQVRYEFRADAIWALAPDSSGYEVALLMHPQGYYTVSLATWHMEFTDEHSAIGTFLGGLSDCYRLKVVSRGNADYRWTIQYREGDG